MMNQYSQTCVGKIDLPLRIVLYRLVESLRTAYETACAFARRSIAGSRRDSFRSHLHGPAVAKIAFSRGDVGN